MDIKSRLFQILAVLILTIPFTGFARNSDSLIISKYAADTLGFKPFSNVAFTDSITPDKSFVRWEYNCIGRNMLRFPQHENELLPDTCVLSQPPIKDGYHLGFSRIFAPSIFTCYISAQKANGKISTFYNLKGISKFIGKIDSQFDAYFWLFFSKGSDIPGSLSSAAYKVVDDGFLIRLKRASNTDIAYRDYIPQKYTDTYFVGLNKQVALITTSVVQGRYIIHRSPPIAVITSELTYMFDNEQYNSENSYTYPCVFDSKNDLSKIVNGKFHYPHSLYEECISGKVYASLIVQADGRVSDVKIVRSLHPMVDKEVLRCLNLLPKWAVSGAINGKAVPVKVDVFVEVKLL